MYTSKQCTNITYYDFKYHVYQRSGSITRTMGFPEGRERERSPGVTNNKGRNTDTHRLQIEDDYYRLHFNHVKRLIQSY